MTSSVLSPVEEAFEGRALFVGGTSSNSGKSWMVTAICAWLRRRGVAVAPFKAQNMSNNSYPCQSGGEIGRAQVAQAEACGLEPEPAMNPILLKPTGNGRSQVVVNGRPWKNLTAREYYAAVDELRPYVSAAYADLARRFDVVVIEGAGSISEVNLRPHDLVNLGLVTRLQVPWILVADIERGGVFGSVVGSVQLLTPEERALFRGFAINKFRGDLSLFDEGVSILQDKTGAPCLGVFPFAPDVHLDAEDSLALDTRRRAQVPPGARIAIVRHPHLSNATDFRLLNWADWVDSPPSGDYDFIILPGTKNTVDDLAWLHRSGSRRLDQGSPRRRFDGDRYLRRLPDAGTSGVRPRCDRIGRWLYSGTVAFTSRDRPHRQQANRGGHGDDGRRSCVWRIRHPRRTYIGDRR